MLARMVRQRAPQKYHLHLFDLPEFDLTQRDQVLELLGRLGPDLIINCAAYTNVDGAETEQEMAMMVNGTAVGYLAEAAMTTGSTLVHISTDYVFDGKKASPYVEQDPTNPQSVYGISKLRGEQALLASGLEKYFIVRTSWLYGPGGSNFVETILRLAAEREELGIVHDQVGSPTFTGDLADAIFSLLALTNQGSGITDHIPYGIYHFANEESCSWYEFAEEIVALARKNGARLKVEKIRPIKSEEFPVPAQRPAYSVFSKDKYRAATGAVVPDWQSSLEQYLRERLT